LVLFYFVKGDNSSPLIPSLTPPHLKKFKSFLGVITTMKKLLVISTLLLAFIFGGNFVPQHSSAKGSKFMRSVDAIPGRYIVVLNQQAGYSQPETVSMTEAVSYELAGAYGANIDKVYGSAVSGFAAEMSEETAKLMSNDDRVAWVEEDAVAYATGFQANPTWNLDRVDQRNLPLNTAYQYSTTGSGVHAYVIDSGIRTSHTEFGGRASVAADFVGDGQNGNDCFGHGTHVAGTIGSATYGVAKNVQLHAVRVLDCTGNGTTSGIIQAANWVTANRINPAVANISIILSGGSASLDLAISNSIASGVTYSIASGNNGADACSFSPARIPTALTVGSVSSDDSRPPYSNQGSCVDIYAPGNSILSLSNGDDTSLRWMSGTSMAAPHVAGVAALYLEANPSATSTAVSQAILNGATPGLVTNTNGIGPNRMLYSWIGGSQPTAIPARVTIVKQVITASGGTSSSVSFGYTATNLGSNSFSLIDNNAPPADRFDNPNVIPAEGTNNDIVVTEANVSGWNLNSIQCTETAGSGMPNLQNSTVDVSGKKATIKVEQGESVTCVFTSQEVAATVVPVSVSGRILDGNGRSVKNANLKVVDLNTGNIQTTMTNSFGYYTFNGLSTTHLYQLSVAAKRFSFRPDSRTFTLSDNLTGVDFTATR
jgi:subtilisin family serine protease